MATEFTPLNNGDTKELRKEIGLPITKGLVYWCKDEFNSWKQYNVTDYEVVETYLPSGAKSILVTLENEKKIRILGDYLSDMQKSSFLSDIIGEEVVIDEQEITGKSGKRIECDTDSYVVVDLETTGRNHFVDEITEIGAIRYLEGRSIGQFNVLIKTNVQISAKVEKITGLSNDMLLMFGEEPKDALSRFKDFVGNSVIVGHNFTTFDSYFLEDAYVKHLNCHFPNDYIDTWYLAKKVVPELKHHNLECLSQKYNIDYSKAHRAIEDCRINHLVYEYLTFGCPVCNEQDEDNSVDKETINTTNEDVNEEELIEVNVSDGWQSKLAAMFPQLESLYELKEHSFSIMANRGSKGNISSYAICVYEFDLIEDLKDSSRNTVLARVKENVLKTNMNIVEVYSKSFGNANAKKRMEKNSDEMINCLVDCIKYGLLNYSPKAAGFACCSRYQECSDARKCIHPNRLYAKACQYRKNLEEGNVFY